MKTGKHKIRISTYPVGSKVYLASFGSVRHYEFIVVNPDNLDILATRKTLFESSDENIYTSPSRDDFGNKDCFHTYRTMDATLTLSQIGGISLVDKPNIGWGSLTSIYKRDYLLCDLPTIGPGPTSSNGGQVITDAANATHYSERRFSFGVLSSMFSSTVIAEETPNSLLAPRNVTLQQSCKYTKEAGGGPDGYLKDWTNEIVVEKSFFLVGTIDSEAPSGAMAQYLIMDAFSLKMRGHFVPDDITDRFYDTLTIPNVNNAENLRDLRDIRKSFPPIVKVLKKKSLKSFSELYLWYKYSYSTTMMDLKAYYEFFCNWYKDSLSRSENKRTAIVLSNVVSDKGVTITTTTRYSVITDTYCTSVLKALGLDINLSNTWDLLPFSFVVDWFINLGDIFSRIDHTEEVSKLNIKTVISSTKRDFVCQPLKALNCLDSCYGSYYYRSIDRQLPLGDQRLTLKNPGTHLIDGTALFIALKKR